MNVYGAPSCTLAAFTAHLYAHSPAGAEATAIWQVLTDRRVDPAVALAFFHHESGCGTVGRALASKSWGNLRWRNVYGALPYPVRDLDGFCAYQAFQIGARHFADHLLGQDGTDSYRGLTTVEDVVPVWAPLADHNTPTAYIAAVNRFASELAGKVVAMPKILIVAGHLRTQAITEEGLCDGLDKAKSAAVLRGSTGSYGEAAYVGDFATRLADAMNATGLVEARAIDCVYHADLYETWAPELVLAIHYHRDPQGRAMIAIPDNAFGFHSKAANDESARLEARLEGGYERATGIPLTDDLVTLRMRQLYTWCYIAAASQAVILELGNANVDTAALYNGIGKIVAYVRDCVLEHFNAAKPIDPPPTRRSTDAPPAAPVVTFETIALELEGTAKQIRELAKK